MAGSVRATKVSDDGDTAAYDLVGDPAEPAVRVTFTVVDGTVQPDHDYEAERRLFVRQGIAAVAGERRERGAWPERVTRYS